MLAALVAFLQPKPRISREPIKTNSRVRSIGAVVAFFGISIILTSSASVTVCMRRTRHVPQYRRCGQTSHVANSYTNLNANAALAIPSRLD